MYKRALVPLDGSVVAETILPFILQIAGPLDMDIVLLRVVRPTPPGIVEGTTYMEIENIEALHLDAEEYLAPLAVELAGKGLRVARRVRRGEPAEQIVSAAKAEGVDLIAMSTHGRGGLGRLLFGSVAQAVLRQADIPVLLLRATEPEVVARSIAAPGRKETR
jgi:nucleotide-binding universal stress UspA family protein